MGRNDELLGTSCWRANVGKCLSAAFAAILLSGCAGSDTTTPAISQAHTLYTDPDYVLAQTAQRLSPPEFSTARENLLVLSPEMQAFVASIDPVASPNRRFRKMLRTLTYDRFEMEYDLSNTTSASEAFASRRGNCISFAAMIVALAREVGLEAHFNFVETPRSRAYTTTSGGAKLQQDILHINAEVSFGWYTKVVEFNFDHRPPFPHRKLTDEKVAMFYLNNLAIEAARRGELARGFGYLQNALELEPDSTMLWTSLGYLHRLDDSLPLAELSYSHALNLDHENTLARNNLRQIYKIKDIRALSSMDALDEEESQSANQET